MFKGPGCLNSYNMKTHISLRILSAVICLHLVSRTPRANANSQCQSQASIFKKALIGHTFDTFRVNSPDVCVKRCENEPKCQSLNFVIGENTCELNKRSKEARPEDYVTDESRIYMSVHFNRGWCS